MADTTGVVAQIPRGFVVISNTEGEIIPPYSVAEVVGVTSEGHFEVAKPTEDGLSAPVVFTLNGPTFANSLGQATLTLPGIVSFSRDNAERTLPQVGESWGTRVGSWLLHRQFPGFRILRTVEGTGDVVLVDRQPVSRTEVIRVTSSTKVNGRYPAKRCTIDPVTGVVSDVEDVWFIDLNE